MKSNRLTVDTPWGKISYAGELSEKTLMRMPDGKEIPFYSLISHTQGDCLPYFAEPKTPVIKTATIDDILDNLEFEWLEE